MSRANSGTVAWRTNIKTGLPCWHARFTRGDGSRTNWIAIDPQIAETDEPGARACALRFVGAAKSATRDGKGETVARYAERWLAQRSPQTARDNGSHLATHVLPVIGDRWMLKLTSADGDALVADLDAKIAAGAMSDKTARNVWGTVGRMLRDAAHAKPATGMRCLEANPFRDVMPPERSKVRKAKQFLYPSELLSLVACAEVPVRWRRNAAIATYLGPRDGEQRSLRWDNVDLEHGTVTLCESFDRFSQRTKEGTKTGPSRTVPIPAPLLPLLREMHDEAGGEGLVCRGIDSQRAMARGLRTWLRKAGVTRASLFQATSVNLNIRWHDLRATCGTWLAVEGRPATEIRDILGHTATSMTDRYMRDASAVRAGAFGEPFPALPAIRHPFVNDDSALTKQPKISAFVAGGRALATLAPIANRPISEADRAPLGASESSSTLEVPDGSRGALATGAAAELSDADLEHAIVAAVLDGRGTVAELLAATLKARRLERAGAVDLGAERARRGR